MRTVSIRPYGGWQNCIFLEHAGIELVITTDVGPRIIRCAAQGKPNLFKEFPEELGRTSGDRYMLFGGHRLWHSPEAFPRSYAPDFDPVEHYWDGDCLCLTQRVEPDTRIQKSIQIECLSGGQLLIRHGLTNRGLWDVAMAPWAMTLMAAGCRAIVPQEDFRPHPEHLYPARTLTLWHYTRMDDPRVHWGPRFIQLEEDSSIDQKFKIGILNKQRWAACWVNGYLFLKTFGYREGARYPDMGANCEMFTMPGFLELESLGPLEVAGPGQTLYHDEIWHIWELKELPDADDDLQAVLEPYLEV